MDDMHISSRRFLLEVYTEEVPARFHKKAATDLRTIAIKLFKAAHIFVDEAVLCYTTPCRLLLEASVKCEVVYPERDILGPSKNASDDALSGFLNRYGADSEIVTEILENRTQITELGIHIQKHAIESATICERITDKGSYYCIRIPSRRVLCINALKELLPDILQNMSNTWKTQMRWTTSNSSLKWTRPIRSLLCILDSPNAVDDESCEVISFDFHGIVSSNSTFAHKIIHRKKILTIENVNDYYRKLHDHNVIVDQSRRLEIIINGARKIVMDLACELSDDHYYLIEHAVNTTEHPKVMFGELDSSFFVMPEEVIIDTIVTHQKYICLHHNNVLSKYFIFVTDTDDLNDPVVEQKIRHDTERVVQARLSDMMFYMESDLKHNFQYWFEKIKKVIYHTKIGSVYDRLVRMQTITKLLQYYTNDCSLIAVNKAAELCKLDLVTSVVNELPELQGVIGSHYAKEWLNCKQQLDNISTINVDRICTAIKEQYMPLTAPSAVASTAEGAVLAIAEKIEMIVAMFIIDEKPTSSRDPFALRRAATGIVRTMLEHSIDMPIRMLITKTLNTFADKIIKQNMKNNSNNDAKIKIINCVEELLIDRAITHISSISHKLYITQSIFQIYAQKKDMSILSMYNKVIASNKFFASTNGDNLMQLYKRINNIINTSKQAKYSDVEYKKPNRTIKEVKVKVKAVEKILKAKVTYEKKHNNDQNNPFYDILETLAQFKPIISSFLDSEMINTGTYYEMQEKLKPIVKVKNLIDKLIDLSLIHI